MIITIDGLSATGKSTIAKKLAKDLHYTYFNTGLVYRFVTYVILNKQLDKVSDILKELNCVSFVIDGDLIFLDDTDITDALYTEEISILTSKYSAVFEIKEWVRKIQRQYLDKGNIIMEGRDIASRVAKDADFKFYLYATRGVRAKRLCKRDANLSLDDAIKELKYIDEENIASKDFIKPNDAIEIDTSNLSIDEVYEYMLKIIKKCSTS